MVIKPAMTHVRSSHPGAPMSRVDSAETMKIPEPIIEPTTIMVASTRPRTRTNSGSAFPFALLVTVFFREPESAPARTGGACATRAQIRPRPDCRHAHKLCRPARPHQILRLTESFLRAAFGRRGPLPGSDRAGARQACFKKRASRPACSFDRQNTRARQTVRGLDLRLRARYPEQRRGSKWHQPLS